MTQKWDRFLLGALAFFLLVHYARVFPETINNYILLALSVIGSLPVLVSAFNALKTRKISVDLLASIALVASLLTKEWASAVFINLMLTSARLFGYYTESKARAAIKSLLKLRPETINVKRENRIIKIPVSEVKVNDLVVLESGDRLAVDGVVEEGEAGGA